MWCNAPRKLIIAPISGAINMTRVLVAPISGAINMTRALIAPILGAINVTRALTAPTAGAIRMPQLPFRQNYEPLEQFSAPAGIRML